MVRWRMLAGVGLALLLAQAIRAGETVAPASEQPLDSKLMSVGLFKNGLAVLRREATLDRPGVFRLDKVPDPIHGTFWVESSSELETQVLARDVEVPFAESGVVDLESDLVGKKVTLHFHSKDMQPISGTVVERKKGRTAVEGGDPTTEDPRYGNRGSPRPSDDFLILDKGDQRFYVRVGNVLFAQTEASKTITRKRPVLLLKAGEAAKYPMKVQISYLARGLSWAPSYKVDITDPKQLKIEQAAVVRNELVDLKNVEVFLISGFPSIQFGSVRSPLSVNTTWTRFFSELNQDPRYYGRQPMGQVMSQVAGNAYFARNDPGGMGAVPETPGSDGIDLYYQSIGERSLDNDSSIGVSVAKSATDYERIVEWLVLDTRDAHGRQAPREPTDDDDAWDALRFKNPFKFPMTSAPAFVVSNGKFGGQRLSTWVNPSEESLLRVNKALSVRVRAVETEAQNGTRAGISERDVIYIGGARYRQCTVDGELTLCNHRKEEMKMAVRRRFSGELLKADDSPKVTLLEEGVWSVNRRNEMRWEFRLKAGEEKKLTYKYTVLVAF